MVEAERLGTSLTETNEYLQFQRRIREELRDSWLPVLAALSSASSSLTGTLRSELLTQHSCEGGGRGEGGSVIGGKQKKKRY